MAVLVAVPGTLALFSGIPLYCIMSVSGAVLGSSLTGSGPAGAHFRLYYQCIVLTRQAHICMLASITCGHERGVATILAQVLLFL